MDILSKAIDEKRNIKPNSLKAYVISMSKLHKATEGDGDFKNLDFLKDIDEIKEFLSKLKLSTQKNYLAAIIVSLDAMNERKKYDDLIEEYRKILDDTHNKYVEDYESIADTGRIIRAEQLAFGCTSRGQAHRLGKWKLLSEQNEKETVSFSTSLNASGLKPGDVI